MIDIEVMGLPPGAEFFASPALETLFAVSALADPSHHSFAAAWAAELEGALSPAEQEALALIRQVPLFVGFSDILVRHRCRVTPEELAGLIAAEPLDLVAHSFCGEFLSLEQVRQYLSDPDAGVVALQKLRPEWLGGDPKAIRLVFARTADLRQAYALLVERVWILGVKPILGELEPRWEACLEGLRSEGAGMAPRELANRVFGRPFAFRFGPGHDFSTIQFVPSYFASPRASVLFNRELCIVVADCRLGPYALQQIRDKLAADWKAVIDPTRLEILRLCGQQRQYGQWLASLLKLKPATIAHHLETLRSVGLLEEELEGSTRYHRLRRERVEELFQALKAYLYNEL